MIRLLLVDDHPVVRAGVRAVLSLEADLRIVAEADAPEPALAAVTEHALSEEPIDVVLMDLQLGQERSGADTTRLIRALANPPRVLILTNYDTDGDILAAVEAGASGYLLKDAPPAELVAAIRAAARGETALAPAIAGRLMQRMSAPHEALSPRELMVLQAASLGQSNAEIASALVISEATVKSHLAHIFTKFGVTSRTAAIAHARNRGIID